MYTSNEHCIGWVSGLMKLSESSVVVQFLSFASCFIRNSNFNVTPCLGKGGKSPQSATRSPTCSTVRVGKDRTEPSMLIGSIRILLIDY